MWFEKLSYYLCCISYTEKLWLTEIKVAHSVFNNLYFQYKCAKNLEPLFKNYYNSNNYYSISEKYTYL